MKKEIEKNLLSFFLDEDGNSEVYIYDKDTKEYLEMSLKDVKHNIAVILEPFKMAKVYTCHFCPVTRGMRRIKRHELYCYSNPDRECFVCEETGISNKTGEICDACIIAEKCGGKSYRVNN